METNFRHHHPQICRRSDFISDLRKYKQKQKDLSVEFVKEFEKCSNIVGNSTHLLNKIVSDVQDVICMKRETLSMLEKRKKSLKETFDVYLNYDEAVERLWKYYENDMEDMSTDHLFDMQHLQKDINDDLEGLIKKFKQITLND